MDAAAKAIAAGNGFRLVTELVRRYVQTGCTEARAIVQIGHVLREYEKREPATAQAMLAHLEEYRARLIVPLDP
jgi:hypothetical protein